MSSSVLIQKILTSQHFLSGTDTGFLIGTLEHSVLGTWKHSFFGTFGIKSLSYQQQTNTKVRNCCRPAREPRGTFSLASCCTSYVGGRRGSAQYSQHYGRHHQGHKHTSRCTVIRTFWAIFPTPPKSYATIFLGVHRTSFWSNLY